LNNNLKLLLLGAGVEQKIIQTTENAIKSLKIN